MTEQEFKRQVWRAYDTVEIEGVAKNARVIGVGFPSLSVRAAVAPGVVEWFKCDQIVAHKSATGEPDDLAIIADLHNRLMAANKRNEDMQLIINDQKEKIKNQNIQLQGKPTSDEELKKIRKAVNKSIDAVCAIKSRMNTIDEYLKKLGITEE